MRTVHAVGIFKFANVQTVNDHGIDVADLIGFRKWKDGVRFFLAAVKQQQLAGRAAVCVNRKIDTAGQRQRTVYIEHAGADRKAGDFAHRTEGDRVVWCIFMVV